MEFKLNKNNKNEYIVGILGLDFFKDKILILDFKNEKFRIMKTKINSDLAQDIDFQNIDIKNKKITTEILINDHKLNNVVFDTGSSIFPLIVGKTLWKRINKSNKKENEICLTVNGWSENYKIIGNKMKGFVSLCNNKFYNRFIYYVKGNNQLAKWLENVVDGGLGNALFFKDHTIILDLIENRFGLLK